MTLQNATITATQIANGSIVGAKLAPGALSPVACSIYASGDRLSIHGELTLRIVARLAWQWLRSQISR